MRSSTSTERRVAGIERAEVAAFAGDVERRARRSAGEALIGPVMVRDQSTAPRSPDRARFQVARIGADKEMVRVDARAECWIRQSRRRCCALQRARVTGTVRRMADRWVAEQIARAHTQRKRTGGGAEGGSGERNLEAPLLRGEARAAEDRTCPAQPPRGPCSRRGRRRQIRDARADFDGGGAEEITPPAGAAGK